MGDKSERGIPSRAFFPKSWAFLFIRYSVRYNYFYSGKVHLYDIVKNKTCAHTYYGHAKAIRDVQFSHDGKNFLSGGFDNKVLYWDT